MPRDAYTDAVRMLARRDLSRAQVRQRLARLGYDADSVAEAIARLTSEGAINDERTAGAIARLETSLRKRGRIRVSQRLAAAGIAPDVADRALDEAFAQIDGDALMRAALEKRLAGRPVPDDERELARLYRHLVGQGFEHGRVMALLRNARRRETEAES